MDPEDFLSTEVGTAVAITAILSNAHVRRAARTVLVRGLATAMDATEAVKGFAANFNPVPTTGAAMQDLTDDAHAQQQERRTRKTQSAKS